jgi:hypothetical protein
MLTKKSRHPKSDDLPVRGIAAGQRALRSTFSLCRITSQTRETGRNGIFFSEHRDKISVSVTTNFPVSETTRPHQPVRGDTLSCANH